MTCEYRVDGADDDNDRVSPLSVKVSARVVIVICEYCNDTDYSDDYEYHRYLWRSQHWTTLPDYQLEASED